MDILEGRSAELVRHIETEMNAAAEDLRFEEAGRLRDRMRAVSTLENRQRVIAAARADTDAVGFVRGAKKLLFRAALYERRPLRQGCIAH